MWFSNRGEEKEMEMRESEVREIVVRAVGRGVYVSDTTTREEGQN